MNKCIVLGIVFSLVLMSFTSISGYKINNVMLTTFPPIPKNPVPENGETDVPINNIVIRWTVDSDLNDVYFGKSNPPLLVAENLQANHYDPGLMDANTTYYWQVVARDFTGETPGPIWNFTTGSKPNRPPNAPELSAEKIGKNMFIIRFKLTDPDGDDLHSYAVSWFKHDWIWIYDGPFPNGTTIEEMKIYEEGTHQIKSQCADRWWKLSDWSYLYIQVSRNKAVTGNILLLRIFERFPLLQRLSFVWRSFIE